MKVASLFLATIILATIVGLGSATVALAQAAPPADAPPQNPAPEAGQNPAPGQNAEQAPEEGAVANQAYDFQLGDENDNARVDELKAPVPLPLSIDASSLRFSEEIARSSYLTGGVTVGGTYDDNLLSSTTQPVDGFTYSVLPHLNLNEDWPRLRTSLNWAGGFQVNDRFSAYNQTSQAASADVRYRLTPHVNLRLHDNFLYTSGFFNQLQNAGTGTVTGTGGIQQPNQAVTTPLSRRTENFGTGELTYQYSARDMVGATGNIYFSRYRNVSNTNITLQDTNTQEADGFYTHGFTNRQWSGVAYKFQRLTFNPATEQAVTHSFLAFHTIYLRPQMALAFYGGAEYTDLKSQVFTTTVTPPIVTVVTSSVSQQKWNGTGGINYNWQGRFTGVTVNVSRKVTDGGGILSAVEASAGTIALRRQLARYTVVALTAGYSDDKALEQTATAVTRLKAVSGGFSLEQRLGDSFVVDLGYSRDFQQQISLASAAINGDINHNRAWLTIGYNFTKTLGR